MKGSPLCTTDIAPWLLFWCNFHNIECYHTGTKSSVKRKLVKKYMKYQLYRYDLVVCMVDMHVCGPQLSSLSGSLAFLPSQKPIFPNSNSTRKAR